MVATAWTDVSGDGESAMTPEEQRDEYMAIMKRQRNAALIVAVCLMSGFLLLVGLAMFQAWQ
jgi:hypothetical protein